MNINKKIFWTSTSTKNTKKKNDPQIIILNFINWTKRSSKSKIKINNNKKKRTANEIYLLKMLLCVWVWIFCGCKDSSVDFTKKKNIKWNRDRGGCTTTTTTTNQKKQNIIYWHRRSKSLCWFVSTLFYSRTFYLCTQLCHDDKNLSNTLRCFSKINVNHLEIRGIRNSLYSFSSFIFFVLFSIHRQKKIRLHWLFFFKSPIFLSLTL